MPELPSISVVMPTYNRADFLDLCLPPLFQQTYPIDHYEVILVDDGSTDGTVEQANVLAAQQWAGKFRAISKANGGPASARNVGFRASEAEIVAFIDSDCVADPDWLAAIAQALADPTIAGVGGPIINLPATTLIGHYLEARQFYRQRVRDGRVDYLLTGNAAFRRSALRAVNGFDERAFNSEDPDLSFRLIQAGYKLAAMENGAVIHHGVPPDFGAFTRTLYRYGLGNYLLSVNWKNGRTPRSELIRRLGAIILSPVLAVALAKGVPLRVLRYWPLVVAEHTAFAAGMMKGILGRKRIPGN